MIRFTGRMRLHFNRHGAAPLVWCVATDDWEIAVKSIAIEGVTVASVYRIKDRPDDEDGKPSAWFEVEGTVEVDGGNATITPIDAAGPASLDGKRCECDDEIHHSVGGCKGSPFKMVSRNGKRLAVCGRCDLTSDVDEFYISEGA